MQSEGYVDRKVLNSITVMPEDVIVRVKTIEASELDHE